MMQARSRFVVLAILTVGFVVLAVGAAAIAIHLVQIGAYPKAGESSLAHVGAIVAGLVSGFGTIVFALLAVYTGLRARALQGRVPSAPQRLPPVEPES